MKLIRSVKITLSLVAALLAVTLSAQILYVPGGSGSGIGNSATGGVGIGTGSPAEQLHLTGNVLLPYNNGASGAILGVPSYDSFTVNGVTMPQYGIKWARPSDATGPGPLLMASGYFGMEFYTGAVQRIKIAASGNVGIGTSNPTQKLSVNGTIRAKEVIVDTGWADYVFASDYKLAPLSEVETHIKENGHLPGIPSAKEVAEHGMSMGEMQSKLLAKIEELTLHVIEQEKMLKKQQEEILELRSHGK